MCIKTGLSRFALFHGLSCCAVDNASHRNRGLIPAGLLDLPVVANGGVQLFVLDTALTNYAKEAALHELLTLSSVSGMMDRLESLRLQASVPENVRKK